MRPREGSSKRIQDEKRSVRWQRCDVASMEKSNSLRQTDEGMEKDRVRAHLLQKIRSCLVKGEAGRGFLRSFPTFSSSFLSRQMHALLYTTTRSFCLLACFCSPLDPETPLSHPNSLQGGFQC